MSPLRKIAIGAAVLAAITLAAVAAPVQDNLLDLAVTQVTAFNFAVTGYSVANGETYGGTTSGLSVGPAYILVKAGRSPSHQVTEWFRNRVGRSGAMLTCLTGKAGDLYFAVAGDLTMTRNSQVITCPNVLVAEDSSNNWWMGSPNWRRHGISARQACTASGATVTLQFGPPSGGTTCINVFGISGPM